MLYIASRWWWDTVQVALCHGACIYCDIRLELCAAINKCNFTSRHCIKSLQNGFISVLLVNLTAFTMTVTLLSIKMTAMKSPKQN